MKLRLHTKRITQNYKKEHKRGVLKGGNSIAEVKKTSSSPQLETKDPPFPGNKKSTIWKKKNLKEVLIKRKTKELKIYIVRRKK